MVLFTLLGLGAQALFRIEAGLALGLIAGLVVAQLIPTDKACGIPPREDAAPDRPADQDAQGASSRDSITRETNSSR